jgi:hypothetical protein
MFTKKDKYPKRVRMAIADIMETAILSIRFNLRQENLKYCEIELNHIHNLPKILKDFKQDELNYYWSITREDYIAKLKNLGKPDLNVYEQQWDTLKKYVEIKVS